ncbi:headcase protein [Trichonephila inaurata madagascariensis]|uniref:Headcase protein n=1 Tax=Trichonephila inaurata madagascariensis TaxID=2747483 RepID=A0A8X7BSG0_9ARAC|nr:headcase protein [Trichonephila inaurata madagascariensis]
MQQCEAIFENFDPASMTICCVPNFCHVGQPISLQTLSDTVRVICNNESCEEGEYMHKVCFDQWEYSVLTFLRSTGRARSWSEKQRLQNLWTKKGYDLAFKACGCKCGKGHLRKDLDWIPPTAPIDAQIRKKRHRKKKNDKPCLTVTSNIPAPKPGLTVGQQVPVNRLRSSSISSMSSTSGSPPNSASSDCPLYPYWRVKNIVPERKERHVSGSIFCRRQDYSSFNSLPRNKINSYHIKIEDEGNQGNDEIRCFILSTLSANKTAGVNCIFCYNPMVIFDRYPLIDGTFFTSPRHYSSSSIPVKIDCHIQYLNAICMACLEGWNAILQCKFCGSRWDGSDLILGTMYSYDIIAANPCCEERLKCSNCQELVMEPDRRFQFFSDYSRRIACPSCTAIDYHCIKPLTTYYIKGAC